MIEQAIDRAVAAILLRGRMTPMVRRQMERGRARARAMLRASASFPNDLGNYRGKRAARRTRDPLSPAERFRRLAGCYLAARMTYRNPRAMTPAERSLRRFAQPYQMARLAHRNPR